MEWTRLHKTHTQGALPNELAWPSLGAPSHRAEAGEELREGLGGGQQPRVPSSPIPTCEPVGDVNLDGSDLGQLSRFGGMLMKCGRTCPCRQWPLLFWNEKLH